MTPCQFLRWLYYTLTGQEAVRLYLRLRCSCRRGDREIPYSPWKHTMAQIGDKYQVSIDPRNANGDPAPVTDVVYAVSGGQYELGKDLMGNWFVTAQAAGPGPTLNVSAITKSGATLEDGLILPDVDAPVDEEAVTLNLAISALT